MVATFPAIQKELHAMRWPDDVFPTVIVSEHPPLVTPQQNARWIEAHEDLAWAADHRRFVLAKGSSRPVMIDCTRGLAGASRRASGDGIRLRRAVNA